MSEQNLLSSSKIRLSPPCARSLSPCERPSFLFFSLMASHLLCTREFRPEVQDDSSTPNPLSLRSLALEALGSDPRSGSPSLSNHPEPIQVQVSIIQRDCMRIGTTTAEVDEEDDSVGQWFSLDVSDHVADPAEWEAVVLDMLIGFNLFPAAHRLLRRDLSAFLDEMTREARDRGFRTLEVTAIVEQLVTVIQASDDELPDSSSMSGSGNGQESPFFLAAMACETIRSVQSEAGEVCVICQDEFLGGTEISQLCCSHRFHSGCIGRWLQLWLARQLNLCSRRREKYALSVKMNSWVELKFPNFAVLTSFTLAASAGGFK